MKNKFYLFFLALCMTYTANSFATTPSGETGALATFATSIASPAFLNDTLLSMEEDTLVFYLEDCASSAAVCIDLSLTQIADFQITTNGMPYAAGIAPCNFDTINSYTYTTLFGLGNAGPYFLDEWEVTQPDATISFSGEFENISDLVDSMNLWDPMGDWILDATTLNITGGNPLNEYTIMLVTVINTQTPSMIGYSQGAVPKGTELNFALGTHEVIVTETATACADTFWVNVACVNPAYVFESQRVGETDTFCLTDFSELLALPNTTVELCVTSGTAVDFQVLADTSCLSFTGVNPGVDTACLVICDELNICDTTYLVVTVAALPGSSVFMDTVDIGEIKVYCLDTMVLSGAVANLENTCPTTTSFVGFSLDSTTNCVSYTGLSIGGPDTACIVICDAMNNCDTTNFYIWATETGPSFIFDTILLNETTTFCADTNDFSGNLLTIINDCPDSAGEFVTFDVDPVSFCVEYTAIDLGVDSACILISDDLGNWDTTYLIVQVENPQPSTISDTLGLGEIVTFCLDTSELFGTIDTVYDICNDFMGSAVNFEVDFVSLCIEVEAIALGVDTACIVFCDNYPVCDTVYLALNILDLQPANPPVALNDSDTTVQNTPVSINICRNDTIPDNTLSLGPIIIQGLLSVGPNFGTAIENSDCTVTYVPDADECGVMDSFLYVICNEIACDTALAKVYIECETMVSNDLKIYNAFSPNGDGVNDVFMIQGIEAFPNHSLQIFNRWGTQVLNQTKYQNDWRGRWEGRDLVDGTYFYLFDRGDGTTLSGYVYLHR
ncbi:MAG: gliding motility-associated C-terminal domain-containing protein [Saprospiraceae bacterium]